MELLAKPGQIISSVFYMCLEKEVLVYGDCALNANPSAEVLAQIVVQSAQAAEALKLPPRVAVLSYATGDSNTGPEIDKVGNRTMARSWCVVCVFRRMCTMPIDKPTELCPIPVPNLCSSPSPELGDSSDKICSGKAA